MVRKICAETGAKNGVDLWRQFLERVSWVVHRQVLLNTLPTLHTDTEPGAPPPPPIQKYGLPPKCSVKWLHCAMFVLVTSLCLVFSAVLTLNLTLF